jgi:tRNA U34 2-thiouridine synthase MnmA/TrmU
MDCHALMFRLAGKIMVREGFDFLFSGEVLGQRPMSQTKSALRYVEKHSDYDGLIVRPLSAKLLPETLPEKQGKVKRENLLDIKGRSRKPQMQLAKKYGIKDYPAPAGGCLLTDKGYSDRLKDLFAHQEIQTEREFELLKHGRHIRLDDTAKIIVGRTRQDNENIMAHYLPEKDVMIKLASKPGPVVLVPNGTGPEAVLKAAAICAGYGKAPAGEPISILIASPHGRETVSVVPILPKTIKQHLL